MCLLKQLITTYFANDTRHIPALKPNKFVWGKGMKRFARVSDTNRADGQAHVSILDPFSLTIIIL